MKKIYELFLWMDYVTLLGHFIHRFASLSKAFFHVTIDDFTPKKSSNSPQQVHCYTDRATFLKTSFRLYQPWK